MTKLTGSQARTSLALGFSSPIIGAALAIIIGLIVYDLTKTSFDIWIWVLIHTILGAALVLGTRWSTSAYNFALGKGRKTGAEKSARNLSFVLSIIWSAWVIILSIITQTESVNKMVSYQLNTVEILPITSSVVFGEFLASVALLVLVTVGIYLLLIERGREAKSD